MDDYKSIVSYQTQDHGYIRIKLRQLLNERPVSYTHLDSVLPVNSTQKIHYLFGHMDLNFSAISWSQFH